MTMRPSRTIFFREHICLCPAVLLFLAALFSCSSAPKRVMLVNDVSNVAYSQLDLGNRSIIEENYDRAAASLASAYRLALSVDSTDLLCKVLLSTIVFKIACPSVDELMAAPSLERTSPFMFLPNEEILAQAKRLASRASERELLLSLCSVYEVRILLEGEAAGSDDGGIEARSMSLYLSSLAEARKKVSKEAYYLAYLSRTAGDVCMAGKDYAGAQKHFLEAAKIHTKNRYLIEIGLDWYCLARAYSLGGRKSDAVSAIETALRYDKDAENNHGIASDYMAYSKILLRGSPDEEERRLAEELASWGRRILLAGE